jgi:hypothetical protein
MNTTTELSEWPVTWREPVNSPERDSGPLASARNAPACPERVLAREADEGEKSLRIGELRRIIVWFEGWETQN